MKKITTLLLLFLFTIIPALGQEYNLKKMINTFPVESYKVLAFVNMNGIYQLVSCKIPDHLMNTKNFGGRFLFVIDNQGNLIFEKDIVEKVIFSMFVEKEILQDPDFLNYTKQAEHELRTIMGLTNVMSVGLFTEKVLTHALSILIYCKTTGGVKAIEISVNTMKGGDITKAMLLGLKDILSDPSTYLKPIGKSILAKLIEKMAVVGNTIKIERDRTIHNYTFLKEIDRLRWEIESEIDPLKKFLNNLYQDASIENQIADVTTTFLSSLTGQGNEVIEDLTLIKNLFDDTREILEGYTHYSNFIQEVQDRIEAKYRELEQNRNFSVKMETEAVLRHSNSLVDAVSRQRARTKIQPQPEKKVVQPKPVKPLVKKVEKPAPQIVKKVEKPTPRPVEKHIPFFGEISEKAEAGYVLTKGMCDQSTAHGTLISYLSAVQYGDIEIMRKTCQAVGYYVGKEQEKEVREFYKRKTVRISDLEVKSSQGRINTESAVELDVKYVMRERNKKTREEERYNRRDRFTIQKLGNEWIILSIK